MKLFYQDYYKDEGIDSNAPRHADLDFALNLFFELTDVKDNFLGLTDGLGISLQFMFEETDSWYTEYVVPPDFKVYSKKCNYEESVELIKEFYLNGPDWKIPESFELNKPLKDI